MNNYNLKEKIKKYFYVLWWSVFLLNTFAYSNPNLSYLDDSSSFSPFLTVIGWIGLFYYFVLHKQILRWKAKKEAKKNFTMLVERLHRRDKELGVCFERNVVFIRFDENILYWNSCSKGLDKKLLNKHGMLIIWHVRHIFGRETNISNKHREKKATWKKWWKEQKIIDANYLEGLLIGLVLMLIVGVSAYTGYGIIILSVVGIILMFVFFSSEHTGKLSEISNYSQSKEDYISNLAHYLEYGLCSKHKDIDNIYAIMLFLIGFIFVGFTAGSAFMAVPIILLLAIEFFILKRYYRKKVIAEIEEIKE